MDLANILKLSYYKLYKITHLNQSKLQLFYSFTQMFKYSDSPLTQKSQCFKKEIRREKIFKKIKLYRNDVVLSENTSDNIRLFLQNIDILKTSARQQEISTSLKIIRKLMEKYDFSNIMDDKMAEIFHFLSFNQGYEDFIMNNSLSILEILASRKINLINFQSLNYQILKTERYEMITKILNICYLVLQNSRTFQKFLQFIINKQKIIQILAQLMMVKLKHIEKNSIYFNFSSSLKNFTILLIYYSQKSNLQSIIKNSYNFASLDYRMIKQTYFKIICQQVKSQFNQIKEEKEQKFSSIEFLKVFVVLGCKIQFSILKILENKFTRLLQNYSHQIEKHKILCDFFNTLTFQTDFCLSPQVLLKLVEFIFNFKSKIWTKQQNGIDQRVIEILLCLLLNNMQNSQTIPSNFYHLISNLESQAFPKTCHLVSLFHFCVERSLQKGLKSLLQIIASCIIFEGQLGVFQQCFQQIISQKEGAQMFQSIGYDLDGQQQQEEEIFKQFQRLEAALDLQFATS